MIDTPIQTKKDVVSIIRRHQDKIKACGVKKLGLFGSFVRNEQNIESDIDLLVEFEADQKTFEDSAGKGERGYILDALHDRDMPGASLRVEGGRWIAEMQRPLAAAGKGELALENGKTYYMGVAIHDAGAKGRKHLAQV